MNALNLPFILIIELYCLQYWFDIDFPDYFNTRQLYRIFISSNLRDHVSRTKPPGILCVTLPLVLMVNGQINAWGKLDQVGLIEELEVMWDCQVQGD